MDVKDPVRWASTALGGCGLNMGGLWILTIFDNVDIVHNLDSHLRSSIRFILILL